MIPLSVQAKFSSSDTYYLFNHVAIEITYHSGVNEDWDGARLLSAKVVPSRCVKAV